MLRANGRLAEGFEGGILKDPRGPPRPDGRLAEDFIAEPPKGLTGLPRVSLSGGGGGAEMA